MNAFFFWLFSAGMIVAGLSVILNRNPVASALCFATSMVFMAALFVMLNAFFLAAVQILVTAGAVMVLFLFIIMLLDVGSAEQAPRQKIWMGATLLLALGFVYVVGRVLDVTPAGLRTTDSLGYPPAQVQTEVKVGQHYRSVTFSNDDTHQIGRLLFNRYVAPFEVTSLLILVATIGVVVLCKEDSSERRTPKRAGTEEKPKPEPALTR
jgi:NADH-quinone oxidoreductase subunit J